MKSLSERIVADFQDAEYAHAYLQENSNMRIAAQVRALRVYNKLTQSQLAGLCSMKQERISKIEMGDFESLSLATLRRLATGLDVHLSVKFESVYDAIKDFVELSSDRMICESRTDSLAKIALDVWSNSGLAIAESEKMIRSTPLLNSPNPTIITAQSVGALEAVYTQSLPEASHSVPTSFFSN